MDMSVFKKVLFFRGTGNSGLSEKVMDVLNESTGPDVELRFSHISYGHFADRELDDKFPKFEELRGKTLVMFECFKEEINMLRFLQLCWAAKNQYGAARIIAVVSFMCYRRQERIEKIKEINRNAWLAKELPSNGVDYVITVTPHAEQTGKNCKENGLKFRCADMSEIFASRLKGLLPEFDKGQAKAYSPDVGSILRAIEVAKRLGIGVLFNFKHRGFDNQAEMVEADQKQIDEIKQLYSWFPDLEYATAERINGITAVMVEDEIDTGSTAYKRAILLRQYGCKEIYLAVTHPVCSDPWKRQLFGEESPFSQVIVGDTIPRGDEKRTGGKMNDVSVADAVATQILWTFQEKTE